MEPRGSIWGGPARIFSSFHRVCSFWAKMSIFSTLNHQKFRFFEFFRTFCATAPRVSSHSMQKHAKFVFYLGSFNSRRNYAELGPLPKFLTLFIKIGIRNVAHTFQCPAGSKEGAKEHPKSFEKRIFDHQPGAIRSVLHVLKGSKFSISQW